MSAPVLMVQGTASGVGKSVIAAGLCRLLRRRGLRVAPFKAQNMSLNAAVTPDGGEIARSTAVQAEASGIEPTVDMNPILLKPEAEMRSQVIVRGKVWGTLSARDYFGRKPDLWPIVAVALDRLRAQYDVVVAEGAGSPAEMNLRDHDLVNMRVALHAKASVVLVGDIDRGGVFAQLIGTLDLLPAHERALVRGLIVNRFRGDRSLFAEGVRFLEDRTGLPVYGVVPMVRDLGLAEEDSASLDGVRHAANIGEVRPSLRIAVVRLPRIANFDDFGPLARMAGVALDYVDRPDQLVDADLVILPGSKTTIADLQFVREGGLAEAIAAARKRGTPIMGICGGYQMLGRQIHDPDRIESPTGGAPGLGLLPHETVFAGEKRTCRVRARLVAATGPFAAAHGREIDAYEIHVGRTRMPEGTSAVVPLRLTVRSGARVDEPDGTVSDDGLLFGTYLHGLFEDEGVRQSLLAWLRDRRGLRPLADDAGVLDADPYDRWANALETAVDLPLLLERAGIAPAGKETR
ncbi:MAG: cobyric acid synthase [Chloroflexota bacterium]|nr:cobyric acid synthase [Chloroflexota bacterium]MDP9470195.1 cobyric acid synthase [Chloroflexota bacterium]